MKNIMYILETIFMIILLLAVIILVPFCFYEAVSGISIEWVGF
jgi:hypothetical protein